MKAEEYRTLCLMCWTLGLFLLLLGIFTDTYYTTDKSWWTDEWQVKYPYRKWWPELLYFAGTTFLFISIGLFKDRILLSLLTQ